MVFGGKIQEWLRTVFRSSDKQLVEPDNVAIQKIKIQKIKKGDLVRNKNQWSNIAIWQVPSIDLKKTSMWTKSKLLIPGFHRAKYKYTELSSEQPVLYLGAETLQSCEPIYHPYEFTAHYFLHDGKVWCKTSSSDSESLYETFQIDELFELFLRESQYKH